MIKLDPRLARIAALITDAQSFTHRALYFLGNDVSAQLALSSFEAAKDKINQAILITTEIRQEFLADCVPQPVNVGCVPPIHSCVSNPCTAAREQMSTAEPAGEFREAELLSISWCCLNCKQINLSVTFDGYWDYCGTAELVLKCPQCGNRRITMEELQVYAARQYAAGRKKDVIL